VPEYGADYYREVCGERQTRFDRARDARVARLVQAHAPPSRAGAALLDIGCGYGHLLSRFRDRYRLYGIDLSSHAAARARKRLPEGVILRADVERGLPFSRGVDVVLAINVIEHLEDPKVAVDNIAGALVPGGLCVIHLPTINNRMSRWIYARAYAGDPTHVYRPTGREVRALFESAGMERLEESYAPHRRWLLAHRAWHPAYLAAFRLVPDRVTDVRLPETRRGAPVSRRRFSR
jgi:SAM-dependent methyltransferase